MYDPDHYILAEIGHFYDEGTQVTLDLLSTERIVSLRVDTDGFATPINIYFLLYNPSLKPSNSELPTETDEFLNVFPGLELLDAQNFESIQTASLSNWFVKNRTQYIPDPEQLK